MAPSAQFLSVLHYGQALIATYGISTSYAAITNLQKYEETSKKAAKVSDAAAMQLHKTRTTQAAGLVGVVLSAIASLFLATSWHLVPRRLHILTSPAMLIITLLIRGYMHNFWSAKSQVPMVDGYNKALSKTALLMQCLQFLEYSWVLTSLVAGVLGYK